uniref:Extended synaptotagmin-like protein 1a n=1 Tax=Astyanax mexicanus TaxID=7994 RepID=A0A8B9HUJ1_ASTMX
MAAGEDAGSAVSAETAGQHAVSVLLAFGKCLGALLPVYLAGYFGLSLSFVVIGLMVYLGWRQHRDGKQARLNTAMYAQENERDFTTGRLYRSRRDLPAWVREPPPGPLYKSFLDIKAHTEHDKRQVLLDLYISYAGNVEINVEVKKYFCKAGVKGIQLHGKLRVILEPLIGDVPLVGAITMFFIRRPKLDINWTGLTNLLDIPGVSAVSDTMVMDAIASFLVLPNRLTVPLVADLHVAQLRSPLPRGIVRIHLLEAENLAPKDNFMKGMIAGKSDPYAVLRVGTQAFTSHHVDNNLNPQWREMYEVIVHEVPGQELEVEVFDKDPDQDDFLGRYCCMKKGNKDPSPMVQLSVQDTTKESRTTYGTNNPVWEDAFTFFIQDPRKQDLDIQVKDDDRSLTLGTLSIPLSRLLSSAELNMDQWFQLDSSGPASRISLNAEASGRGQVKLSIAYSTKENRLVITVHACRNLTACSKDGSDPYVSFLLQPDKNRSTKRKTSVKKRDLNPEFNERFDFDLSLEESTHRRLDLSVKNSVSFMSREKELIGKVS